MKIRIRHLLVAALFAAAPLVAPGASAQERDPGPFGMIGPRLERFAAELRLTPEQRQQWDAQMQKSKAQFEAMRKARAEMHAAVKAELARAEPDLAALAARGDAMRDQGRAAHKEIRDGWLRLYATFNAEQKAAVKKRMLAHFARMERLRDRMHHRIERMHEWHHGPRGPEQGGPGKGGNPPTPPKN